MLDCVIIVLGSGLALFLDSSPPIDGLHHSLLSGNLVSKSVGCSLAWFLQGQKRPELIYPKIFSVKFWITLIKHPHVCQLQTTNPRAWKKTREWILIWYKDNSIIIRIIQNLWNYCYYLSLLNSFSYFHCLHQLRSSVIIYMKFIVFCHYFCIKGFFLSLFTYQFALSKLSFNFFWHIST